jgi:hypothetical protein
LQAKSEEGRSLEPMHEIPFEREKFRELIVYIAAKTADDPSWGDIKLNKVLYWTDFFGYSHLGHAVTGARYFKLQHGPAPRALKPVRQELVDEGAVRVLEEPYRGKARTVTIAERDPDLAIFKSEELELVDNLIEQLRGRSGTSVSQLSHKQSVGWNLVELKEDIPYYTALVSNEPPSEETLVRARELAARSGW